VPGWLQVVLGLMALVLVLLALAAWIAWRDPRVRLVMRLLWRLRSPQRVRAVWAVACDPRVPWAARAIPVVLVAYLAMPFDVIPDFIPVLGQLDDAAVVGFAIWLLVRLVPEEVIEEHLRPPQKGGDAGAV